MMKNPRITPTLCSLLVTAVISCGDDGESGNGDCQAEAQVALGLRIRQPDGTTSASYLAATAQTPDQEVGVSDAIEFPGQRRFRELDGKVFIESTDEPRITRYRNCGVGQFEEESSINFSELGFNQAGITKYVSSDLAVSFGVNEATLVRFDPTDMTITDTTSSGDLIREDFDLENVSMVVRGDRLFIATSYRQGVTIVPEITVGVVDLNTFTLEEVLTDTRCSFPVDMFIDENDDIYVQGDNGFNVIRPDLPACLIRIPAGEQTFDDYLLELAPLMNGRPSTRSEYLGDGQFITYALYPDQLNPDDPLSVAFDPVRKAWLIDMNAETGTEIQGMPFTKVAQVFEIDGERLVTTSQSFESTEVYAVDAATAAGELVFTTEGQAISILDVDVD
jgi:hypothetical protein